MRVCFDSRTCLFLLGSCLTAAWGLNAAEPVPARRLTSVVRVDRASGRLVRSVVVASKPLIAKAVTPGVTISSPPANSDLQQIVEESARRNEVDPLLVHSVIQVESNYNANAVSPKGAQGLMQLIPSTARRFGAVNSFDVRENVEAGVKYLKYLNSLYPNDLRLTLAAYNAGEGAVAKYRNNIPPYRETEDYVFRVGQKYGSARRAADRNKAAIVTVAEKTAAVERHLPIESFVDAEGHLHMRTVAQSEGTPQ